MRARRGLLRSLAAGLLLAGGIAGTAGAAEPVKVVYHVADGLDQASRAIVNARNHIAAAPGTKIAIVTLADGVKFLVEGARDRQGRPFDAMVAALASQGVEFYVCGNTLNGYGIPASSLLLEAKVIPSGVAEIARLQAGAGYAYLRP